MRRTTVLVKKPTSPAVASSSRPATGVPRGMSVPQPCRVSRAASPACTVMNTVAPCARASRRSASCAVASRAKGTVSPAEVATGGRGRSVGSSNWSGSPASACRQWASWASASAVGSAGGAQERLEPGGVVHVLAGQRCEFRCAPLCAGGVGGGQVPGQGGGGAVARYVVQQQEEGVMVRRLAEQHGAQRGLGGEVEAVPHGLGEVAAGLGQAQHRAGRRVVGGEDVLTGCRPRRRRPPHPRRCQWADIRCAVSRDAPPDRAGPVGALRGRAGR
ncbi:hypothetical protein SCALM49S_05141 [Streptomyces californicus]